MFEDNYIPILTYLQDGEMVYIRSIKIDSVADNDVEDTLIELDDKGLVKMFTGTVGITNKGKAYLRLNDSGKLPKNDPIIHIGHNITGQNTFNQSDFIIDNSRDKQTINKKKYANKSTKSLFEWIVIIIGLIGSIVGIYWFFTK